MPRPEGMGRAQFSEDAGATWSKPVGGIPGFVPNLKPKAIKSGRLIITGNLMWPYTDSPDGISGWVRTGIAGLAPTSTSAERGGSNGSTGT